MGELLCKIGLTAKESAVYLELLRLGRQAVSVIAKYVDLNRTTTYSVLNSLRKKGLVGTSVREGVRYFVANDPNTLVGFLDQKMRTFDYFREEMLAYIPQIRCLSQKNVSPETGISFHEGVNGVKYVMEDCLNHLNVSTIYPLSCGINFELKAYFDNCEARRDLRRDNLRKILFFGGITDCPFESNFLNPFVEMRFLDSNPTDYFVNMLNICDSRVSIMNLKSGFESAIVIDSLEIAMMKKKIFEMLWNTCKIGRNDFN